MRKKDYSELTFTDDFMFCKVLENNLDLCKGLLELTLGFRIKDLKVSQTQTQIEEKYDARGIRLDVYAVAEDNTIYDIEMQTTLTKDLPKRTRYYQGMIDLNLIGRGARFGELKRTYIIFICTEDPFEKNLPIYTFENTCRENTNVLLGDEAVKVIVNAQGDRENLSNEMKAFLDFLQSGKSESTFTSKLKEAVERLLNERDGLALGICNGFQALIKLGLVPYGKICGQNADSPTLTFNTINRHVSKMVYTKVVSNKSPWLSGATLGSTYTSPASHGEGRFVASDAVIEKLFANGQVATQYADFAGNISMNDEWNVNGSYFAIEGITSEDGRAFGKMAHAERRGDFVAINIYGEQDLKIFESGVNYFK